MSSMNSVRIIGGEWRRRVLRFPDAEGLRPTPDRVRETLFNWLGQDLSGLSCLDLFAGSGALGFEAASRGAERVVMVEQSASVAASLRANARLLGAETRLEIVHADAVKFASSLGPDAPGFDVLFLDPPYKQGWIERVQPWLDRLVKPEGWLYVESEAAVEQLGAWHVVKQDRAGQVHFHLMRRSQA